MWQRGPFDMVSMWFSVSPFTTQAFVCADVQIGTCWLTRGANVVIHCDHRSNSLVDRHIEGEHVLTVSGGGINLLG